MIDAIYFSDIVSKNRATWHLQALKTTQAAQIVFLDPDNGLETKRMYQKNGSTEKHVKWDELNDYYNRGQSVILYQHRPQMMKKDECINNVLEYAYGFLLAENIHILEFPKYTNRYYFFFTHSKHDSYIKSICNTMATEWKGLCNQLNVNDFIK